MTFEEAENTFPNGLHDAELRGLEIDYVRAEAVVRVGVDMRDENDEADGPSHKPADLLFSGVALFIVEAPHGSADATDPLWLISAGVGQPSTAPITLPPIPTDCFLCWFFIPSWNSFIRIAARDVTVRW
jgi:hypothetical protein